MDRRLQQPVHGLEETYTRRIRLGASRRVMADSCAPGEQRNGQSRNGDEGNQRRVRAEFRAAEEAHTGIKRRETKRNNPAQEKLNVAAVNGKRVTAKRQKVPRRGMHADAVFHEKRDGGEKQEDGDVNHAAAEAEEHQQENPGSRPMVAEAVRGPDDNGQADDEFLKGFDAEGLEQDLQQGTDGTKQDAVEFAFDDVGAAELVEIHAQDVEQPEGDQGKAVEEENFFEAPAGQPRDSRKQHNHKEHGK